MRRFVLLLLAAATFSCARAALADSYDAALFRAAAAERRGDLRSAAAALERAVPEYPQDYAIAEALAWTYFREARYADAERAYRLASDRAPASDDARLGVALSLSREGRCDDAVPSLRSLFATNVGRAAREGLAACAPMERTLDLSLTGNEYLFPSHPWKSSGTGGTVSGDAALGAGWTLGGAYRYVRFTTLPTSTLGAFSQNEGYADLGVAKGALGLTIRGAVVADGTGALGTSPHAGVSGRWSPAGDLLVDATASAYPDMTVLRGAMRWRVPVAGPLSVEPGLAAQEAAGAAYVDGSLALLLGWPRVSAWIGGKYGTEVRPAYLDARVVYDVPERGPGGAWAGARVSLGRVGLVATYAFDWLQRTDSLSPSETAAHAFALGPFVEL